MKRPTIETAANGAILCVAVLLGVVLVKNHLLPRQGTAPGLASGDALTVPNVRWNAGQRSLILILSETCRYCTESAPFYRRLVADAGKAGLRIVAVLPSSPDRANEYLRTMELPIPELVEASPTALGIRATPTLVVVDDEGRIIRAWTGKLSPAREAEVMKALAQPRG